MLRGLFAIISVLVVLFASLYQLWLKDFLAVTIGLRRSIQSIEDFPYTCHVIEHEKLEACEDLWLDEEARVLYAACTGKKHRSEWNQALGRLNVSGRRLGGSDLIALDIDSPGEDGLYGLRVIEPVGYDGAAGDGALDLVGFDATVIDSSTIQFYLVNQRPPVDGERNFIDPSSIGANSTIDVFELKKGERAMRHVRTVASPEVWTPNRPAILNDGAFLVTNDHSAKVGLRQELDPLLGGGNVAYCSTKGECHAASNITLKFPNGLRRGNDNLVYVPSTIDGIIYIFELQSDNTLQHIDSIFVGYPMDNLSLDANGDFYVAGFPNMLKSMKAMAKPLKERSPSTVLRIRKAENGWQVKKILEDVESAILSDVTTAVHDAKTGNLFLGAVFNNLVVCEPRNTPL